MDEYQLINKYHRIAEKYYIIAEANGISRANVQSRFWNYGWDMERVITEPLRKSDSVWLQWKETSLKNGISNECYCARVRKGMTPEEAATTPVQKRGEYRGFGSKLSKS
jgi:hypothetical protein